MAYRGYTGRRRVPLWLRGLIALILAGALAYAALLGTVLTGGRDQLRGEPEVMIVLGCKVEAWGPSVLLQDRLDEALDYWEDHPDILIVTSGGQGPNEPAAEARAMADYLIASGVPEEQMLLEHGRDPADGAVVVSNGFHLARVRLLAERNGYGEVSTLAAPSSHLPSLLWMYVREPMALVKSFLLDR